MELEIEEVILAVAALFSGVWLFFKIKGNFRSRIKAKEVYYLGNLEVKIIQKNKRELSPYLNVQCKGLIPICTRTNIGFSVSVMTEDDKGRINPVLSMIDSFQEPESTAFQNLTQFGEVDEHQGFENWTTVCKIPTFILQPTIGGKQKLKIIVMLVDMNNLPKISFGSGERGIFVITKDHSHVFGIKGYDEEDEHINKARALSVRVGVAVAMSDGKFDDKERMTLDIWIKKMIMPFNQEKQAIVKDLYNDAKNDAEQEFSNLEVNKEVWGAELKLICDELRDTGEEVQKYEALELAHEIMVSDGIEHDEESKCIFSIAKYLGINAYEIEASRSNKIHKLDNVIN
jgi:tellurite resistance protein